MSGNIPNHRDHFKAIAVNTQGTPTQKLLAILADVGITNTAELVEITGLKVRAIQAAKRSTMRATECGAARCAQHNAHQAQQVAPKAQHNASPKKVSPTPPSKNNTTTTINTFNQTAARDDGLTDGDFVDCKAAFNGSTEAMLTEVERAMGGHCPRNARQWLANLLRTHGQQAVIEAFQKLLTAKADGTPIAHVLRYWDTTARNAKRDVKAVSPDAAAIAAMTVGVVKHARPAPGSVRMPEVARA